MIANFQHAEDEKLIKKLKQVTGIPSTVNALRHAAKRIIDEAMDHREHLKELEKLGC